MNVKLGVAIKMENKLNKDALEDALRKNSNSEQPKINKEIEIGFHQGALNTLVNERNELIKMIQNIEGIMQAHLKRLEELGVSVQRNSSS